MRKVAMCRAKPYELIERIEGETKKNNNQEETHEIIEETRETENHENIENSETSETESDDKIENSEIEIEEENETETEEEENENETERDLKNDRIGAKYLQIEKSVYFMDYQIYSVEVPVKDHGKPEIVAAKNKEMDNLKFYETYVEVKDEGQETIGSRWVVTENKNMTAKNKTTKLG